MYRYTSQYTTDARISARSPSFCMEDAQWLEDQVEKLKQNRDALVERLAVIDRDNIVGYLSSLNL